MPRRLTIVFLLLLTAGSHAFSQKAADVQRYIATYRELAISEMKRTGVPAAIKLAQGIHETEAGNSELVRKSNNHFGIKCKTTWRGDKVFHDDDAAGECFRSYKRADQSYMDHSDFLKNSQRYAFLFELDPTDYEGWAYGLKKAGYATNVRYSRILISIIKQYQLQDYTLIALGRMKQSDQILVSNVPNIQSAPVAEYKPAVYPSGKFTINHTRVIFAPENTAWLAIAEAHNIPLSRLWDFNDLENDDDILLKGQLVYLQRKRKVGANEFHIVQKGETLYDICQSEGIRLESLLELNHLNGEKEPAVGEKLYLQQTAAERPALAGTQRKEKETVKHAAYVNFPQDN